MIDLQQKIDTLYDYFSTVGTEGIQLSDYQEPLAGEKSSVL